MTDDVAAAETDASNHSAYENLEASQDNVDTIMSMGFDEASARRALRGGQTVERALESLLS